MRRLLPLTLSLTLALAAMVVTSSAQAQTYDPSYPVCLHVYGSVEGERIDCVFTSLAQCAASAAGRPAMCEINPYFAQGPVRTLRRRAH